MGDRAEEEVVRQLLADMWNKPPRDRERIPKIMEALERVWTLYPDWRFGQLMNNIMDYTNRKQFFIEDDDFMKALDEFCRDHFPEVYTNDSR